MKLKRGLSGGGAYRYIIKSLGIFVVAFTVTFFISKQNNPVGDSFADSINVTVGASNYYVNVASAGTVNINVGATPGGTEATASDALTVKTNIPSGYKLYLGMDNADTNGNRLYKDGNNTSADYLAPTSGTPASPAALSTNAWGFSVTGAANTWAAVPLKGQETLIHTATTANETGETFDIHYGVKAGMSLPAGTYSGAIVYSVLADASALPSGSAADINPATGTLGTAVTIATSLSTSMDIGGVTATIGGQACTNITTSTATGVLTLTCTVPTLSVGQHDVVVTVPKFSKTYTITNGFNYINPFWSTDTLQAFSQDVCDTVATPSITATTIVTEESAYTDSTTQVPERTLQDTRDDKYYLVRKLADGNCWMVQDLDLEAAGMTLRQEDTDLNTVWTWSGATSISNGASWAVTNYAATNYYSPATTQTGDWYFTNGTTRTTWTGSFPNDLTPTPTYLAGNYYTWSAATAGSVNTGYSGTSRETLDSICPRSWRLPPSDGNKSWNNLLFTTYGLSNNATDAAKVLQPPFSLVRAGGYDATGHTTSQGAYGYFFTSTSYPSVAGNAYGLYIKADRIVPQFYSEVGHGYSIRCVTR